LAKTDCVAMVKVMNVTASKTLETDMLQGLWLSLAKVGFRVIRAEA